MATLEKTIRASLREFAAHISETAWRGREREAVSLFTLGFLQKRFGEPTRIAIEAAVQQLPGRLKKQVCKDLVIWPRAGMTVWDESWALANQPLCVLEWKVAAKPNHKLPRPENDVSWLCEFSRERLSFEGYSVAVDLLRRSFLIRVSRVKSGRVFADWFLFK